jgi:hypothetical protein
VKQPGAGVKDYMPEIRALRRQRWEDRKAAPAGVTQQDPVTKAKHHQYPTEVERARSIITTLK